MFVFLSEYVQILQLTWFSKSKQVEVVIMSYSSKLEKRKKEKQQNNLRSPPKRAKIVEMYGNPRKSE